MYFYFWKKLVMSNLPRFGQVLFVTVSAFFLHLRSLLRGKLIFQPLLVVIEEQAPAEDSKQQEETEQMRIFWRFIEGMLTNIGALPLDRIQTMLRLAPNYTRTIEQLGAFMEAARREGLVTVNNGLWKLNR